MLSPLVRPVQAQMKAASWLRRLATASPLRSWCMGCQRGPSCLWQPAAPTRRWWLIETAAHSLGPSVSSAGAAVPETACSQVSFESSVRGSLAAGVRNAHAAAPSAGPCVTHRHGDQWCPVEVPDLLQLTAQAAAHKGDRSALEDVMAAVESTFGSPGYLLASLSRQPTRPASSAGAANTGGTQQQGIQQRQEQQGEDGAGPQPMDSSPRAQAPASAAFFADGRPQQQQQQQGEEAAAAAACGLDVERAGTVYQALLKLYEPEVVATLGNACVRLLDSEWRPASACCGSCFFLRMRNSGDVACSPAAAVPWDAHLPPLRSWPPPAAAVLQCWRSS